MAYFPQDEVPSQNLPAVLQRFLAAHESTTSFISAGVATREAKASFVQTLLRAVDSQDSNEVVRKSLTALRILSREPNGCQDLFQRKGVNALISLAQLSGDAAPISTKYSETPVIVEALKCLCNVLLQNPPARATVRESGGAEAIAKILKAQNTSLPPDSQFLFLRLLFLLTVDDQTTVVLLLSPACDLPATLVKLLHRPAASDTRPPPPSLVSEIMKTVYNLMAIGNVPPPEGRRKAKTVMTLANAEVEMEWVSIFENLLPEIIQLLLTTSASPPLSPPLSHVIHTLLNFPLTPYRSAFSNGAEIVERLCAILGDTLATRMPGKGAAGPGSPDLDEILPPLLIVMSGIARQDTGARERMRNLLLPDDIDRSKPLDQGTSVTARLIGFMTALAVPNVRESVCDLLFVLCNEDAEELVRYTGYGHAAGFLYAKGLLAPVGGGDGKHSAGSRPGAYAPLDPITGEHDRRGPGGQNDWDGMTDDEKEEEAEKLMVLFEKLNKTGVIKAVVPGMP